MRAEKRRGDREGLLLAALGLALLTIVFGAMMAITTMSYAKKTVSFENDDAFEPVLSGVQDVVGEFSSNDRTLMPSDERLSSPIMVCDPPISLIDPDDTWILREFRENNICRVWNYKTTDDARSCGEHVLGQLQAIGGTILESGYLDLGGSAWGCAFDPCDGTSFVVTMIPQKLGIEVSGTNELRITVTQYMVGDAA